MRLRVMGVLIALMVFHFPMTVFAQSDEVASKESVNKVEVTLSLVHGRMQISVPQIDGYTQFTFTGSDQVTPGFQVQVLFHLFKGVRAGFSGRADVVPVTATVPSASSWSVTPEVVLNYSPIQIGIVRPFGEVAYGMWLNQKPYVIYHEKSFVRHEDQKEFEVGHAFAPKGGIDKNARGYRLGGGVVIGEGLVGVRVIGGMRQNIIPVEVWRNRYSFDLSSELPAERFNFTSRNWSPYVDFGVVFSF